jgi:hypothetical protein
MTRKETLRIAKQLGIDWDEVDFSVEELQRGIEVEKEHGPRGPAGKAGDVTKGDVLRTARIALAHLAEVPDYYARLDAMEEEAKEYWGRKNPEEGEALYLVSCVGQKLNYPAPADKLYVSDWFKKAKAWIESRGGMYDWLILSAKHGLIEPQERIAPYNLTLRDMPKKKRERWAEGVYEELMFYVGPGDRIVILAGRYYREFLEPWLRADGFHVEVPLAGLGIGEQKRWLAERTKSR